MRIHYYSLKKVTIWSPLLFLSFANQEASPRRSLGDHYIWPQACSLSYRFEILAAAAFDFVGSYSGAYTCRGGIAQIRDDTSKARHLVADLFNLVEN